MVERVGREILGVGNKKAARKNKEVEEEEGCPSCFSENGNVNAQRCCFYLLLCPFSSSTSTSLQFFLFVVFSGLLCSLGGRPTDRDLLTH